MAEVEEGGRGDEDDLQHPEAGVADGEGGVVADGVAARLSRVAPERRLLVAPGRLHRRPDDQDTEDKEDREPHLEEEQEEEEEGEEEEEEERG